MNNKDMNYITHTTLARMARPNIDAKYDQFSNELKKIFAKLQSNPIIGKIERAEIIPDEQFQNRHESFLFAAKRVRSSVL